MKIRKQESELTIDDMCNFPIWEFAYGEKGNVYKLMPSDETPPIDIHKTRYLIHATYTLKNGQKRIGFIKPIDTVDIHWGYLITVDLYPVILTEKGPVYLWYGAYKPKRQVILKNYSWLGIPPSEIFPITVSGDVEIVNGIDAGTFKGFLYCVKEEVKDFFTMQESDIKVVV